MVVGFCQKSPIIVVVFGNYYAYDMAISNKFTVPPPSRNFFLSDESSI